MVLHDGGLEEEDAALVRTAVEKLPRKRILFQPILIGNDLKAVEANRAIFGLVLTCPQLAG